MSDRTTSARGDGIVVRRAVIPCGGRGTRMRMLTAGAPKELIPVAGVPVLERVARECAASGIDELLIIISPEKDAIVDHMQRVAGDPTLPARIAFAVQREPRGLADAIRLAGTFAAGAPFAVALPDNLFIGAAPGVAQVTQGFARSGQHVVAVVEIPAREAARRGPTSVYAGVPRGDEFDITRIPPKGERHASFDTGGAPSAFTGVGRYVFRADVFDVIDEVERELPDGAELDDVPVMQRLLSRHALVGRRIAGRFLDVGLPSGYEEANALLEGGSRGR